MSCDSSRMIISTMANKNPVMEKAMPKYDATRSGKIEKIRCHMQP